MPKLRNLICRPAAKRLGWTLVLGALLLSRSAASAAAWQPRTTDWATHPAPAIGDWGFDRPGFPKGLYLHGVTMPEGHFPAQALPNPIIYDNDEYADVLDDDVLCAMASLGKLTLAAQIITPIDPKGVFKQRWQDSAFWHYDRCSRSGMCWARIPKPVIGNTGSKPDPNSPGAKAYVDLILAWHGKHPDLPLLVAMGGQSATLASAFQRNPAIADKVIVFYVSANAYNGQLSWASEMVCRNLRVVHAFHYWWPEVGLPNQLQALPRNNAEDWNDLGGEWAVLANLKNVLGRASLPFMDEPYKDKFNCGGFLERLKRNHQYNSGHHHKGWGDDAYSDGNIFVAWQPAMYRNALLRNVRGGQVIDHEYHLDWLDRRAVHAASFPFLSNPDAYRDCESQSAQPKSAATGDPIPFAQIAKRPATISSTDSAGTHTDRVATVTRTPGLVAFWDFVKRESEGERRFTAHVPPGATNDFALAAGNYVRDYWGEGRETTYADFPLLGRGPFGNAIRIRPEADPNFRPFLYVPRARLHDSPLDLKGAGRSVSIVGWAIRESGNHALAGIWHEGTDLRQASTANIRRVERGQRQYALFAGLNIEGSACGHVSENGASSFLNRYALHKCNSAGVSPAVRADAPADVLDASWQCLAMTFDHERRELTGWLNGVAGDRWLDHPKDDRFIASAYNAYMQGHYARTPAKEPDEDATFPQDQYYNPPEDTPVSVKVLAETAEERLELREYRYTKVRLTLRKTANGAFTEASRDLVALRLNPWWYPHAIYAPPDDGSGGPFTIGRVTHSSRGVGFTGWIGGVAVFKRALSAEELDKLTRSASPAKGGPSGVSLEEVDAARGARALYRAELDKFRKEFAASDRVPDVPFFLFGLGSRTKHWYQAGQLREVPAGRIVRRWAVREAIIVPPEYRVVLALEDGGTVEIREDEAGVWLTENGRRALLEGTDARVNLPDFAGHRYPRVLRVLHQELLVNVIHGQPVPNLFVYPRAWLRDAAMMGMAFEATGNLPVIRDWILGLREVYDRNNAGEEEADNLGQALYLISLVSDRSHPLVEKVLAELPRWEVIEEGRKSIRGRSDFATHPVYQTKWLKFGLRALGLPDPYTVPLVKDSYSALFWWDYRDAHVIGGDARDRGNYPYLGWAVDHFHGAKGSPISNRDYPLTWEQRASQADYSKLNVLDPVFARERIAAPHTWHAAEVFLYLLKERPAP